MTVTNKQGRVYEYDYDRSAYMRKYYKRKRDTLLPKATKRYRNICIDKLNQHETN